MRLDFFIFSTPFYTFDDVRYSITFDAGWNDVVIQFEYCVFSSKIFLMLSPNTSIFLMLSLINS